jgi:hypothetical protein
VGDGSLQSHSGANLNVKRAKNRGNVAKPIGFPSQQHAGAVQGFRQVVGYGHTTEGLGMGQEVVQYH